MNGFPPIEIPVPGDAALCDVLRQAAEQHLHLVIDQDGNTTLTPFVLPGMQKLLVRPERKAA